MDFVPGVVALVLYSALVSCFAWLATRRFDPGLPRLLAELPLFAVSVFPSTLFDRANGFEAILYYYCVTNYLWLMNCKLLAIAMNRGPLITCLHRPLLFAWLFVFPVNVQPPNASGKELLDYSFATILYRLMAEVAACVFFAHMAVKYWDIGWIRDFSLSWLMYALLTSVMEVAASLSWAVLGIQLMPHFNQPWLTTSISEFWSVRWNLVVGGMLRELIYDPILEGSFIPASNRPKPRSHRQLRQLVAVSATFIASGAMHWGVIYYIVHIHAWYNFASFLVHGGVVVMERIFTHVLHRNPKWQTQWSTVPWLVKAVVAQTMCHWIAHNFFWRELVHCKEARDLARTVDVLTTSF